MGAPEILIVEDEAIVALDLRLQLQELGYNIVGVAASGEQALEAVQSRPPELILMDVRLQGRLDGIATATAIRERHGVPVFFLTSHSDDETVQRAAQTAPYGYLTKPYQVRELRAGIEVALSKARLERQLREANRWFTHTLQSVSDALVVVDRQGHVQFLNPVAEALTGWSAAEAVDQPVAGVVRLQAAGAAQGAFDTTADAAARRVREVLDTGLGSPIEHAVPLWSRHGKLTAVDASVNPVDDDRGERLGAVVVLRDATARVAQDALLRASEARFRDAFEQAPLGMALASSSGSLLQVNDALCRLLGREGRDLLGVTQASLTAPEDRAAEVRALQPLLEGETSAVQFEKRMLRCDGQAVWVLASVSRLPDVARSGGLLFQVHDLTERKRAEANLAALEAERVKRQAVEMASALKSDFLGRVSHEMRTPLNAVIGLSQLLNLKQATMTTERMLSYADHIHTAGQHLLALVTDLLDLNQAAQGTLQLQLGTVGLAQVVEEAVGLVRVKAETQRVQLDTALAPGLHVRADAQRLRQVLLNLLFNAIKFSRPESRVLIRAEAAASGRVLLMVDDNGIGMTAAQMERLFEPFDRLGAESTQVPGTGLGLSISRSLVTQMQGTLHIDSVIDVGTTASVELPAA